MRLILQLKQQNFEFPHFCLGSSVFVGAYARPNRGYTLSVAYLSRTCIHRVLTPRAQAFATICDYSLLSHNAVPASKGCARVRCTPHLAAAVRAYERRGGSSTRRARSMLRCLACSEPSLEFHCACGARHGLSQSLSPFSPRDYLLVVRVSARDWHRRRLMRTVPSP